MKEKVRYHYDYYYYEIVSKNIKKYREKAGLTQQQLADMIDVSMHYISQIESLKVKKYFTLIILGRIADVLHVDIAKFFEWLMLFIKFQYK